MSIYKKLRRWYCRVFLGKYETIKPTGTMSLLSNTHSGLHPVYSREYKRRVL